jgi:hypothetical protein
MSYRDCRSQSHYPLTFGKCRFKQSSTDYHFFSRGTCLAIPIHSQGEEGILSTESYLLVTKASDCIERFIY